MLDNTSYDEDYDSMITAPRSKPAEADLKKHCEETAQSFEENGYLILNNALPREKCDELVQHMFNLEKEGKLVQDSQCPLSGAIYGDPQFDALLEGFREGISQQVGKELLPTYTYARLYKPGEELKRHKDRPSCEISATLTLGYDDSKPVWPIFFDEDKEIRVNLDVGELAIYKGCEVEHWRPKFKGNWQVQVFLHFVDANGPYKDHATDGRGQLGVPKEHGENGKRPPEFFSSVNFNGVLLPKTAKQINFPGYLSMNSEHNSHLTFSKEECEKIIAISEDDYGGTASIGSGGVFRSKVSREIRSATVYNITPSEETAWIWDKVCHIVALANEHHFRYDISHIEHELQLIHYQSDEKVPGHYNWHIDAGPGTSATRKISFTAQLSDPDEYTGCDLLIRNQGDREFQAVREQGSISLFPSYMPHCVSSIESGERYALVIWVHGDMPFR